MTILCDTNVISELARPRPNEGVLRWSWEISLISISVITLEEISYGLAAKPNIRIQEWFKQFLQTNCNILPVTDAIARQAGSLRGALQSQGKTRTQADILIAATAKAHMEASRDYVEKLEAETILKILKGILADSIR
jgi:toxin FitB